MGMAGCSKRYCSLLYEITEEIILFFDIRGRVISANNAACVKLGYDHKEICGVGIMDIFDGTFCCNDYGNIVVPDMIRCIVKSYCKALRLSMMYVPSVYQI